MKGGCLRGIIPPIGISYHPMVGISTHPIVNDISDQSSNASTLVIYESRVVNVGNLLVITTVES